MQLKLSHNSYLFWAIWLGKFSQKGILNLFPLYLTCDCISKILLVWSSHIYFLPGYWPIRILVSQYKWKIFTVYKSIIPQYSTNKTLKMLKENAWWSLNTLMLDIMTCLRWCKILPGKKNAIFHMNKKRYICTDLGHELYSETIVPNPMSTLNRAWHIKVKKTWGLQHWFVSTL